MTTFSNNIQRVNNSNSIVYNGNVYVERDNGRGAECACTRYRLAAGGTHFGQNIGHVWRAERSDGRYWHR